jgi:hypothetical protein
MVANMPGIIAVDIVGGNRKRNPPAAVLRRDLIRSIDTVTPSDCQVENTAAGIKIIVPDAEKVYPLLKSLSSRWAQVKNSNETPLILGLKIGLHAGFRIESPSESVMDFSSLGKAFRLAWAGPSDSIRLSYRMFNILEDQLKEDRAPCLRRDLDLGQGYVMDGYEIPLATFLPANQYRASITSPDDLMLFLAANPHYLHVVEPRTFEVVTCRLFEDLGYEVELTQQTRDEGIDVIALRKTPELGFEERYLIQCKRYSLTNRVDVSAVRELVGVGQWEPHTGLILATTSTFTAPARELASRSATKWRLHLTDYFDLQAWLKLFAQRRGMGSTVTAV